MTIMGVDLIQETVHVQVVYGEANISHLKNVLIPALRKSSQRPIKLLTINYNPKSQVHLETDRDTGFELIDVTNTSKVATGFAANHNFLFRTSNPSEFFIILNPDCVPQAGCIDILIERKKREKGVAIVEGRQWPFEHPKEYDPQTLDTPWSSGAFALIDSRFYSSVGGMDELYFLYVEDVDLSWQAWLNNYRVIYEPKASVVHYSGGPFYRADIISSEQYFSLRNFLLISKKFFGNKGEIRARRMLKDYHDKHLAEMALQDYDKNIKPYIKSTYDGRTHPNLKILGINLFHNLRFS
jgi:hypothetical protein